MNSEEEIIELEPYEVDEEDSIDEQATLHRWIRIALVVLTVPWIIVFAVATQISPYYEDGEARKMGTHMQLGLPDCNFKDLTGVPCPSCGMTTSFCLLIRADVWSSMKANFAGTMLASFGLLFIPWAMASAFFGRFVFVRALEMLVFRLAIIFLVLLFGRWMIVLIWEFFLKT
jgi:Protein of unknown function (DUF2752)